MIDLTIKEREFLESLLNLKPSKHNGYYSYNKWIDNTIKHFKRSRVLIQLHLNKKLEIWEVVHHKDGNKENDKIENLEISDIGQHLSNHYAGKRGRNYKPRKKSNKLKQDIIDKIIELSKSIKNYSEISRIVGVSDETIRRYVKNPTT